MSYYSNYSDQIADLMPYTVDVGSGMIKVGFSGDDAPRAVFPSIVGRPKNPGIMVGMDAKDCFVGDEAQAKRGILKLKYPIPKEYGTDINFNDLEKIFHHSWYNELCTTPDEHPLFITSLNPPGKNRKKDRSNLVKLTSIMFETFDMPAVYICDASVCGLYASGRTTGTVLDIGHGKTLAQSIYEGLPIEYSRIELEEQTFINEKLSNRKRVSGDLITDILARLLQENHKLEVNGSLSILEIVRDIKEKLCVISPDRISTLSILDEEMKKKFQEKTWKRRVNTHKYFENPNIVKDQLMQEYELPDGGKLDIEHERYLAPEILFRPKLIDQYSNLPGIHKLVLLSIEKCNNEMKRDLYQNIVLSGGSTMFEGIVERLDMEIRDSLGNNNKKYRVKINAPAERKFSTWIGGSIISSMSTIDRKWVLRGDYDEHGPTIIERMCPCTTRKNNQMGFFKIKKCIDVDEDERREYILFQCFVGTRVLPVVHEEEEEEKSFEFLIKLFNQSMEVRFKTLLLL